MVSTLSMTYMDETWMRDHALAKMLLPSTSKGDEGVMRG